MINVQGVHSYMEVIQCHNVTILIARAMRVRPQLFLCLGGNGICTNVGGVRYWRLFCIVIIQVEITLLYREKGLLKHTQL